MPTARLAVQAMGTRFELVLYSEAHSEVFLRAVGEEAGAEIEELERRLSRFRADSLVAQINRSAAVRPIRLDADLFAMFQVARQVQEESAGAFDITVGSPLDSWGFAEWGAGADGGKVLVGMEQLVLEPEEQTIYFLQEGLAIDLGGIAKGFALDCAGEVLRAAGIRCALLHGGTSAVLGLGSPPNCEAGWRVEIFDSAAAGGGGRGKLVVQLKDAVLAVSAAGGRMVEPENELGGHIFDPRSPRAVSGAGFAAVVTGAGRLAATLADAWSTALVVLGERPIGLADTVTTIVGSRSAGGEWGLYTVCGQLSSAVRADPNFQNPAQAER